jgi:hypothetical protein
MKSSGKFIVGLFVIISWLGVSAQKIDSALNRLTTQHPSEKIYIHYDKEYYVAGETIWFRAYLYSNGMPAASSNNFYLQLINIDGKVISNKKYPVKGATIKGDIELPNSLPQGYYHIRALTPGMLNSNPDFFYSKNLFIFNPSSNASGKLNATALPSLSVHFYPESGHLVAEILSVIAFNATDSTGHPASISGTIKADDGTIITTFKTFYNGMGKVQFRPQAGKKYIATIEVNGQTGFYPLPEVETTGINLRVENESGGKMFLLSRSKREKEKYAKLRLVAELDNLSVFEKEINFDTYFSVKGHLLTDSLPSGILHFTVFDNDGKPLAERLTFVNNGEYESKGKIEIVKNGTGKREENIFEINFPDQAQRSFSVAVTDAETSSPISPENIITKFLLTDELKGYIDNPAWYFQEKTDTIRQAALDNLMLTRGWSRFSWKKIIAEEVPEKKYRDNYLVSVSGKLSDSKTNGPAPGGNLVIFMESEDSVNHNFEVEVGNDGKFRIDSLLFYGKARFYYAYKTAQGKEKPVNISLDPQPIDRVVEALPFTISEGEIEQINAAGIPEGVAINKRYQSGTATLLTETKELGPVMVKAKSNKRPIDEVNESYTSGLFTGMGKMNFDNINEPENNRALSVFDFVKRSVQHVVVEDDKFVNRKNFDLFEPISNEKIAQKQQAYDSLNKNTPNYTPGDMGWLMKPGGHDPGKHFEVAIFLNESPAYVGILKTIRMDEVALIKFYDPGFIGAAAAEGPGGALSVYTKKDISPPGNIDKLDHVVYNGYSLTKEFYSPDYRLPVQQKMEEDIRTTLYWNPELYTDAQSKTIRLSFYNNDFSNKLKIVVEGFDATGRLIHIEKIIDK